MLAGLAAAREKLPALRLVFAGRLERHKTERIEGEARRAGVCAAIRFLGFTADDDLRALYRHALAHVFISRAEGFGYTVIEAMASGCPVITTRCGSLAEIADGCAELVEPDEPGAVGDAILRLATGAEYRARLREAGLQWSQAFACESQARGTVGVLRMLLARSPCLRVVRGTFAGAAP
ncbi:MAG: glycosyltransferase, partial [Polyangiaceae bacterium]|nr:glycosyltransferase [Polyangiaceae bacterium]